MITFSDESSFGKESETLTEGLVDVDTLLIELEETRLMVLVVDSEIVVASFTSNILVSSRTV